MNKLMSFLKDEDGQGMIEYAIIIGAIAIAAIVILFVMRDKIRGAFEKVNSNLDQMN